MATAITLGLLMLLMLGSALALLRVDRRALPPVLATAALIVTLGGYFAALLH
jgi:hypothetical protein